MLSKIIKVALNFNNNLFYDILHFVPSERLVGSSRIVSETICVPSERFVKPTYGPDRIPQGVPNGTLNIFDTMILYRPDVPTVHFNQ